MKVMKPKKVPVWANEATAEPQVPVSTEQASATQGELSDAEWLKQRMSSAVDLEERVFEQSDDEDALKAKSAHPVSLFILSPSASSLYSVGNCCRVHLSLPCRYPKGCNERHHLANFSAVCSKPYLFVYGRRPHRTLQVFRGNIPGKPEFYFTL